MGLVNKMIKSEYLKEKFDLIQRNIKIIEEVNDQKLASMLSSYLVVSISGAYEDCIEYLFIQRSGKSSDKEIQNLVKSLIDLHFRNPNYGNIKKMVKALDSKYGTILRDKIAAKNIDGINSIVTNKNNVAHGEVSNATIRDIKNYHENALKIFKVLEEILLKEV